MQLPFRIDLTGKVAVVTGGSGVLCRRMAMALAECGAGVAVLGRRLDAVEAVAAEIRTAGGKALAVSCDVLNRAGLTAANATIEKELGAVDILVNGAGGNHPKGTTTRDYLFPEDLTNPQEGKLTFFELEPEGLQYVLNLNLIGTVLPTQVFGRSMAKRAHGVVINISSMAAFTPLTRISAYSSAKAAVNNFTQWLAVHLSRVGVRVNAIAPGFFLTEQNRNLLTTPDGSPTPRANTIVAHTPMGRFGRPDELLGTLLWLVSDEASGFVTGTVIPVDGGFSAFSGV
jgi:NAD(P)-dependent dehydrogenase (short-subunit alcohol dehydrogenase family)